MFNVYVLFWGGTWGYGSMAPWPLGGTVRKYANA